MNNLWTPLVALIIGGLVFSGLFSVFAGLADNYGVSYDTNLYLVNNNETTLTEAFNTINETKNNVEEIQQTFDSSTVEDRTSTFAFLVLPFKVGKLILDTPKSLFDVGSASAQILGVPNEIWIAITSIVFVIIVITVVMLFTGRTI